MSLDMSKLKSPDLYDLIVDRLYDRFGALPSSGVAAGQAVASAIYDIVGLSSDGPYRDLDIFINKEDTDNFPDIHYVDRTGNRGGIKRISSGISDKLSQSSYDGIFDPINKNGYVVNDCVNLSNDHNYVLVHFMASNVSKVQCIVDGFDINCCEAGIDFTSREVYWTPAFDRFLRTKELEITNYLTPAHSIVRAAKKSEEIRFSHFDKDYYIRQAQTVRKFILDREEFCGKSKTHKGYFFGHMFSQGYLNRFEKQRPLLGDHFYLSERKIMIESLKEEISLYALTPKQWDGKLLNIFDAFHRIINGKNDIKLRIASGFYEIESDLFYINEIAKAIDANDWRCSEFFELMSIGEKEIIPPDGMKFLFNILFSDKAKLIKSMSNEEKVLSAKLIASHAYLGGIQHLDWPNDKIRLLLKNIRNIDKGQSRYLISEIERLFNLTEFSINRRSNAGGGPYIYGLRNKNSYQYISKKLEWLTSPKFKNIVEAKLNEKLSGMDKRVATPLFSGFLSEIDRSRYSITELKSEADLFFEGNAMKHCVGGYWDDVRLGKSFIFSVVDKENKSNRCTLEVGFIESARSSKGNCSSDSFAIKQNKSYKNIPPEKGLDHFCHDFVKFCNEKVTNNSEVADISKSNNREQFLSSLGERIDSLWSSKDDNEDDMCFYN